MPFQAIAGVFIALLAMNLIAKSRQSRDHRLLIETLKPCQTRLAPSLKLVFTAFRPIGPEWLGSQA